MIHEWGYMYNINNISAAFSHKICTNFKKNGNHAFSHSSYQILFYENFVSHLEGPTEQFGMNLIGPRLIVFLRDFSHSLSFHVFS